MTRWNASVPILVNVMMIMVVVGVVSNTNTSTTSSMVEATRVTHSSIITRSHTLLSTNDTKAPTLAPIIIIIPTESPSNHDDVPVVIPTTAPVLSSKAPTVYPTPTGNTTKSPVSSTHPPTMIPTFIPGPTHPSTSSPPTLAPVSTNTTGAPIVVPPTTPTSTTSAPISTVPTSSPSKKVPPPPVMVPTVAPSQQHHFSIFQIIAKTIAWLIIIFLSVVAFGAAMSHRYRIYYFLRGLYYTVTRFILRLSCTNYILSKLRFSSNNSNSNNHHSFDVNTIIFDNDMNEGLLMRENEYD